MHAHQLQTEVSLWCICYNYRRYKKKNAVIFWVIIICNLLPHYVSKAAFINLYNHFIWVNSAKTSDQITPKLFQYLQNLPSSKCQQSQCLWAKTSYNSELLSLGTCLILLVHTIFTKKKVIIKKKNQNLFLVCLLNIWSEGLTFQPSLLPPWNSWLQMNWNCS